MTLKTLAIIKETRTKPVSEDKCKGESIEHFKLITDLWQGNSHHSLFTQFLQK